MRTPFTHDCFESSACAPAIPIPLVVAFVLALAGCVQHPRKPDPEPPVAAPVAEPTPLRFNVEAGMNDTWNAVGQILVRTP